MKRLAVYAVALLSLCLARPTRAEDKKPPERMTLQDAAQLDAAVTHETLIYQQADHAAQPFEATVQAICKKYKLDRAQLGKAEGVDVATGLIQRAPASPPTPPAAAPPKPDVPKADQGAADEACRKIKFLNHKACGKDECDEPLPSSCRTASTPKKK